MINRILMAFCLLSAIFTSCGRQETPGAQTATPTLNASDTPTQSQDSFPVRSLTGEISEFATFDAGFQELSPGTYMLVRETDEIYYYSLDGLRLGKVVSLKPEEPSFSDDGHYYRLRGKPQSPSLQVIDYSHSGQFLVQILDLKTGETRTWQTEISGSALASGLIYCDGAYSSPSGRWLAGDCGLGNSQYIYLIDLQNGTGKLISPSPGPCQSSSIFDNHWVTSDWSPDEMWLFAHCLHGSGGVGSRGCLISMQSQEFTSCRVPFYDSVDGWSPDGSKVVMLSLSQEHRNYEDSQLYVTNAACLTDEEACERYIEISIGYDFWSSKWDSTGKNLIWAKTPLTDTDYGYTTIGFSDVITGTTRIITQDAPVGNNIFGLSPDDKEIIVGDDAGLIMLNIKNRVFRRLPRVDEKRLYFLGWIEIP